MNSVKLQDNTNIQKSATFLYSSNTISESELKNQSHSQAQKKNKTSTCKTKKVKNCSQKIINKYKIEDDRIT